MKQADPSRGFFLCFLMNLLLHFWWGAASLILMILHFWLEIPWIFAWATSAIWGIQSLILTAVAYWANQSGQERDPVRKNRNPYSAKTEDLFPGSEMEQEIAVLHDQTEEN